MTRQDIAISLNENQGNQLNQTHITGFKFLESVGANTNWVSDDQFSKVGKLGKAISDLESLRIQAKSKGVSIPPLVQNSSNFKDGWSEAEFLGLSILIPSKRTIDKNQAAELNLSLISKESLTKKDLEIFSKVGMVLKETSMIQSLLAGKHEKPAPIASSSNPVGIKPMVQNSVNKEPKKLKSWEMDLYPDTKKKSW